MMGSHILALVFHGARLKTPGCFLYCQPKTQRGNIIIMLTITKKLKELRHRKIDIEVSLSQKSLEEDGLQGIHLRKYQLDGVSWMKCCFKSGHGCILGDEMGLGKTIQVRKFITKK